MNPTSTSPSPCHLREGLSVDNERLLSAAFHGAGRVGRPETGWSGRPPLPAAASAAAAATATAGYLSLLPLQLLQVEVDGALCGVFTPDGEGS